MRYALEKKKKKKDRERKEKIEKTHAMQFKLLVLLKSHRFILKSRFKLKSSSKLSVWRKNVSAVI